MSNSTVKGFSFSNKSGSVLKVNVGYKVDDLFKGNAESDISKFFDGSDKEIRWKYEDKEIIKSNCASGYPTTGMDYVIAIYDSKHNQYSAPNNAVIYKADGTLHKVLKMPSMICDKIRRRLDFLKQPNPPLHWADYPGGLLFSEFKWDKSNGEIVNRITIELDRGSFEMRKLNPETAEFGECLWSELARYARIS